MLYIFKSTAFVFIGSLLMICGFLSGTAIFGAMIRDYTPAGKAGMFQGLRIVGQVLIPGIIGPAVGAYVLRNAETIINDDGTTSFVPNANIYMAALAVAVMLFIVLFIQFAVMRKEVKKHE